MPPSVSWHPPEPQQLPSLPRSPSPALLLSQGFRGHCTHYSSFPIRIISTHKETLEALSLQPVSQTLSLYLPSPRPRSVALALVLSRSRSFCLARALSVSLALVRSFPRSLFADNPCHFFLSSNILSGLPCSISNFKSLGWIPFSFTVNFLFEHKDLHCFTFGMFYSSFIVDENLIENSIL